MPLAPATLRQPRGFQLGAVASAAPDAAHSEACNVQICPTRRTFRWSALERLCLFLGHIERLPSNATMLLGPLHAASGLIDWVTESRSERDMQSGNFSVDLAATHSKACRVRVFKARFSSGTFQLHLRTLWPPPGDPASRTAAISLCRE